MSRGRGANFSLCRSAFGFRLREAETVDASLKITVNGLIIDERPNGRLREKIRLITMPCHCKLLIV